MVLLVEMIKRGVDVLFEQHGSRKRITDFGNRAGRIEPRAVKRRPKAYPLLMIPRAEARLSVLKKGHPKKIK